MTESVGEVRTVLESVATKVKVPEIADEAFRILEIIVNTFRHGPIDVIIIIDIIAVLYSKPIHCKSAGFTTALDTFVC